MAMGYNVVCSLIVDLKDPLKFGLTYVCCMLLDYRQVLSSTLTPDLSLADAYNYSILYQRASATLHSVFSLT